MRSMRQRKASRRFARRSNTAMSCIRSLITSGSLYLCLSLVHAPSLHAQDDIFTSLIDPIVSTSDGSTFQNYSVEFSLHRDYQPYGPFAYFESEYPEDGCEHSMLSLLPPLYTCDRNRDLNTLEMDFLYPLIGVDRYGEEYRVHIFQIISWAGGQNSDDQMTRRYNLFPLIFYQKSELPNEDYWAVLPFYGKLYNRFWKNEHTFIMVPAYIKTRKKDVVTKNYFYPFVHVRKGNDNLYGWQFWPFIGQEHRDVGTMTDGWGDDVLLPGHDREFYLWPIILHQKNGIGTDNPEEFIGVVPFYQQTRSPNRDHSLILWPFFNWANDREKKYREWGMPYPFIVIARGEGKTTNRIFPFYGNSYNKIQQRDFILWPLWKKNYFNNQKIYSKRERICFYLYSDLTEKALESTEESRRTDLWPLVTAKRSTEGTYKVDMPSPFEPFFPENKSIKRNWTTSVSLWHLEENQTSGELKESLFWNLYRHDQTPKQKRWSALFGLIEKVEDEEYGSYWRFFYSKDKRRAVEKQKQIKKSKELIQPESETR